MNAVTIVHKMQRLALVSCGPADSAHLCPPIEEEVEAKEDKDRSRKDELLLEKPLESVQGGILSSSFYCLTVFCSFYIFDTYSSYPSRCTKNFHLLTCWSYSPWIWKVIEVSLPSLSWTRIGWSRGNQQC